MQVFAVNPTRKRRIYRNPGLGGMLMTLTNPRTRRKKRARKNPSWLQLPYRGLPIENIKYSELTERRKSMLKKRRTLKQKAASKRNIRKAIKARMAGLYKKPSKHRVVFKSKRKYTKRRKHAVMRARPIHRRKRHYVTKSGNHKIVRVVAHAPLSVYSNSKRSRMHRRFKINPARKYARSRRALNRADGKLGFNRSIAMKVAMTFVGFFAHRLLTNAVGTWMVKKGWVKNVKWVAYGLPVFAYIAFNWNKSPIKRKVPYSNELLIGASVSAASRLAKDLFPKNKSVQTYLGEYGSEQVLEGYASQPLTLVDGYNQENTLIDGIGELGMPRRYNWGTSGILGIGEWRTGEENDVDGDELGE